MGALGHSIVESPAAGGSERRHGDGSRRKQRRRRGFGFRSIPGGAERLLWCFHTLVLSVQARSAVYAPTSLAFLLPLPHLGSRLVANAFRIRCSGMPGPSRKRSESPLSPASPPPPKRAKLEPLPDNPLRFWREPSGTTQISTWNVAGLATCNAEKWQVRHSIQ